MWRLVVLLWSGCDLVFPRPATLTDDAIPPTDASTTVRCPTATAGDDFERSDGEPGPFWDASSVVATTLRAGKLELDAAQGVASLTSHWFFPLANGSKITIETPEATLDSDGAFAGLKLRFGTAIATFQGVGERSLTFGLRRTGGTVELFVEDLLAGASLVSSSVPYDPDQDRFLQIASDVANQQLLLRTSADGAMFRTAQTYSLDAIDLQLDAVQVELIANQTTAAFGSVCSDLAMARSLPFADTFSQPNGNPVPLTRDWGFVSTTCNNAFPNGSDEMFFDFQLGAVNDCVIATHTAIDLTEVGSIAIADVAASGQGQTLFALETADRRQARLVFDPARPGLFSEVVDAAGTVTPGPIVSATSPRFWRFARAVDGGLSMSFQATAGGVITTFGTIPNSDGPLRIAIGIRGSTNLANQSSSFLEVTASLPPP